MCQHGHVLCMVSSMYCMPIDVGFAAWTQVVSGLAKHMPLEALHGARVVLVANLKPANMRGVKSQAMVLAATSPDGAKACSFLHPGTLLMAQQNAPLAGRDGGKCKTWVQPHDCVHATDVASRADRMEN